MPAVPGLGPTLTIVFVGMVPCANETAEDIRIAAKVMRTVRNVEQERFGPMIFTVFPED
jgi:homoaconitase/3-isopropylmalate dehydratase large subunit